MHSAPVVYVRAIHDLARDGSEGYERALYEEDVDLWAVYRDGTEADDGLPVVWIEDFQTEEEATIYAERLAVWANAELVHEGPGEGNEW